MPKLITLGPLEAFQYRGNNRDASEFCPSLRDPTDIKPNLILPTVDGEVLVNVGDWIIKYPNQTFGKMTSREWQHIMG
jgi:hypothetical protein